MKKVVDYFTKILHAVAIPLIFISVIYILTYLLSFINFNEFKTIYDYFISNEMLLYSICFSLFIAFCLTDSAIKSFVCLVITALGDLAFFSITSNHFSIVVAIVFSLLLSKGLEKSKNIYNYILLLFIFFTLSIIMAIISPYVDNFIQDLCQTIKGKSYIFGLVKNPIKLIFGNDFENYIYTKSYSQSLIIDNGIVSGVKNIFVASKDNPYSIVSKYLTPEYFINVFVSVGIFSSLYSKFHDENKLSLIFCTLCSVLAGNSLPLSVILILYNPIIYVGYIILIFISFVTASVLDIRIGFEKKASLIEMITYSKSILLFIIAGAIISILSYFAVKLILSKFSIDDNHFPKKVKKLIESLGGENNIECVKNNNVYVKNPNLVDILKLDCDIHENVVNVNADELNMLKDYF